MWIPIIQFEVYTSCFSLLLNFLKSTSFEMESNVTRIFMDDSTLKKQTCFKIATQYQKKLNSLTKPYFDSILIEI